MIATAEKLIATAVKLIPEKVIIEKVIIEKVKAEKLTATAEKLIATAAAQPLTADPLSEMIQIKTRVALLGHRCC